MLNNGSLRNITPEKQYFAQVRQFYQSISVLQWNHNFQHNKFASKVCCLCLVSGELLLMHLHIAQPLKTTWR